MLQLLMAKLGGDAAVPDASATSTPGTPRLQEPRLQEMDGGKIILLSEPFDKSWRKVGLALDRAGIVVDDIDRSNGVYFMNVSSDIAQKKKGGLARLMFWRDTEDRGQKTEGRRYQVTVRASDAISSVSVLNMAGNSDESAQRILDSLYKQLIKQHTP